MTATIKPILKYPGAKWSIADWIIGHFPAHAHYVEPFFGSGAVFFNKAPAKHEVINDLSGDVVNLFRVIRDDGERLAALIEMTPWAREEYELSYQPCEDAVERARRFVVQAYQGHGSIGASASGSWSRGRLDRSRDRCWSAAGGCRVHADMGGRRMRLYQPYPHPEPVMVRSLYLALRAGAIDRKLFASCMRYLMGHWLCADPGRE